MISRRRFLTISCGALGAPAHARVGRTRVAFGSDAIALAPGQQLSFNGITQGYATDLVSDALRARGFGDLHVNPGEHAAFGPARRLGLSDPTQGPFGHLTLQDGAVATSSPAAPRSAASRISSRRMAAHRADPPSRSSPTSQRRPMRSASRPGPCWSRPASCRASGAS
ncbi:FAD:protein FMN transferase [Roseobacter cerasinus]|uniref:FAD:protein FMN transferase n=1 Tax=Roseobacter cerasinus TaxID=2602289 RepID=UPI00135A53D8|nr:FAD:protein FMN transferase [Roseobacter cerasinus]